MNRNTNRPALPPKWMVKTLEGVRKLLLSFHDRLFPGNVVLYEKFQYFYLLPALYVAAELNIAGLLTSGEKGINALAAESDADPESLYRVMRALSSHKIFREGKNRTFRNTRLSFPLTDGDGSLRHMLRHHLGKLNWQITGELLETVRTGKDGFNRIYNQNIYDFLNGDAANYKVFDQSMTNLSSLGLAPLLQSYSFSSFKTLADIGGGEGFLLANIVSSYPALRGILFDTPSALEKADEILKQYDVEEKITRVEGNFLEAIPEGADGYILKNILHNWNDATCLTILSNIRDAMPANGKILIVEMIVPEPNKASAATLIDIQMLTSMPGGKERTRAEFETLLAGAGLTLHRYYSTIAPISIIEARLAS
ncbi:MAG: methyltransferase [Bacteroidales bacterium]|nr:methyltransferase [Bacteroidales bacterium]